MATPLFTLVSAPTFALVSSVLSPLGTSSLRYHALHELVTGLGAHSEAKPIVFLDLASLGASGHSHLSEIELIRAHPSGPRIFVIASESEVLFDPDVQALLDAGANHVFPNLSAARWTTTGAPFVEAVAGELGCEVPMRKLEPIVRSLAMVQTASGRSNVVGKLEARGTDLLTVVRALSGDRGVEIANRTYRLKSYPACFLASEAIAWLVRHLRVDTPYAVEAGRALQAAGLIYHVAREQEFSDQHLFFRFARYPNGFHWKAFLSRFESQDGVEIIDRSYRGTVYRKTLVGKKAVQWMESAGLTVNEAMTVGQRMIELSMMRHVTNDHAFKAEDLYYRLRKHEMNASASAALGHRG